MNKISNNINDIKNNKNLNLEHTDNSISINDTIEYSINQMEIKKDNNTDINVNINMENCEKESFKNIIQENNQNNIEENINDVIEKVIEIPIKKKKGRKSKKNKELELEQTKPKEIIRAFPKLSEKIFDVLTIDGTEYFYDTDFNLLLDKDVEPVGFKDVKKFMFYSEISNVIENVKKDDLEVKNILKNLKNI